MPFLAPAIPYIVGGGAAAAGLSKGRTAGRAAETDVNQRQDLLKMQAARMMEDALQGRANLDLNQRQQDLNQRQFALNAPGKRAGNSVRGDIMSNGQDFQINGPIVHTGGKMPQITGGLRPSMFSDSTRQLGGQISRDALLQQLKGDSFEPFKPLPAPSIPDVTPPPQAGGFDKFLNIFGGIGGVLGHLPIGGRAKAPGSFEPNDENGWG